MSGYYLAFCVILIAGLVASVWAYRSIVSPAFVWLLGWALAFLFTGTLGYVYVYDLGAFAVLVLIVLLFPLGAALASVVPMKLREPRVRATSLAGSRVGILITLIGAAAGGVGAIVVARSFGHSFSSASAVTSLAVSAGDNMIALWRGEARLPTSASATFGLLQIGCAIFGLEASLPVKRRLFYIRGLLLVTAAGMWSVSLTSRSYLLVPLIWMAAGYCGGHLSQKTEHRVHSAAKLALLAIALPVIVGYVLIAQSFRMGDYQLREMDKTVEHMRPWVAGYIPAFSAWYADFEGNINFGRGLLEPFTRLIGIGLSPDFHQMTRFAAIGNGERSNAMTGAKLLVDEFGPAGAAIFVLVLGGASGFAYRICRGGGVMGWVLYMAVFLTAVWFTNYWFFIYGARVLALLGLIALAATLIKLSKSRQ